MLFVLFQFLFFLCVTAQSSSSESATASASGSATSSASIPQISGVNASLPLCAILSCRQILTQSNSQCPNATAQCLCSSSTFQAAAAHCIKTTCTTDKDQRNAYDFATQVCAQVGVTLPSFEDVGKSSGTEGLRVSFGVVLSVVFAATLFVGGLA